MRGLGASFALVAWVLLGTAAADETADKQQHARQLFEQGRAELAAAGDDTTKIASACEKFEESIKLDPEAAGTMLNLGLCNEKLDKYKTALYWFRKAQARAAETGLPEAEDAAKMHTVDLANKVATVRITFSSPPPDDTRVKIDDDEVAPADYLRAEVDPGHHTLVVGAPGHKVFTQEFDVVERGGQTLNVELVAGSDAIIIDRGAGRRRTAVYLAIGGGVLWATAGGVSLWAKRKYNPYADACDPTGCSEADADDGNHYKTVARWVATPIFAAGALAIGGAIFLYVTAPEKERIDRTVLAPVVTQDQLGFAVTGAF
jgi:hypothetical protein